MTINLTRAEAAFTVGAIKECIERYEISAKETADNPVGAKVYALALKSMRSAQEVIEAAM